MIIIKTYPASKCIHKNTTNVMKTANNPVIIFNTEILPTNYIYLLYVEFFTVRT